MEDRVEFNPATGQKETYGITSEENVVVKTQRHGFVDRVKQWAENVKKTVGNLPPRGGAGPLRPF